MFRFQTSLILFVINGTAKTKVAILPFLCYRKFVKASIGSTFSTDVSEMQAKGTGIHL